MITSEGKISEYAGINNTSSKVKPLPKIRELFVEFLVAIGKDRTLRYLDKILFFA